MKKVVFGKDMKQVDSYTIHTIGIDSLILMERAAYQTFLHIKTKYPKESVSGPVVLICGTGNNGADGLALARMLKLDGYCVQIKVLGNLSHATEEFRKQSSFLKHLSLDFSETISLERAGILIDAIFGIGLSRDIEGEFAAYISKINDAHKTYQIPVIAVDIPSGVNGTSGQIQKIAVQADVTVTFGSIKSGMLLFPGAQYCGEILCEEIGFFEESYQQLPYHMFTYDLEDLSKIYKRKAYSNKGSYGKILIIAGNAAMSGAAYFSAMAAYRTGSGIVRILTHQENKEILAQMIPEAIITTYPTDLPDETIADSAIQWADSIVIGPGMGVNHTTEILLSKVLQSGKKCVIDADGLNTISTYRQLFSLLHKNTVITPHLGEMSRLTKISIENIKSDLIGVATAFSKEYNVTVVLKDTRTVVAYKNELYINRFGNNGMATGGSGDVLSGLTGCLIHCQNDLFEGACLAVFLHSICGDEARKECGEYSLMARSLINALESISVRLS